MDGSRMDTMTLSGAGIERPQYNQANAEFGWHIRSVVAGSEAAQDLRLFHIDNEYSLASHQAHCLVTEDRTVLPSGASIGEPRNKSR